MKLYFAALTLIASAAFAQEVSVDKEQVIRSAGVFSRCSATYKVLADVLAAAGQPAQADYMRAMSNSAVGAAMYLFGQEHLLSGNDPKPYGEFMPQINALADAEQTRLKALMENKNAEAFEATVRACEATVSQQDQVVRMLRDESVAR